MQKSVQEQYAPHNRCFGCGPANERGLRIRSFPHGDQLVCEWMPEPHHEAFPNVLCGGIIGTLLDCHANWTACYSLMLQEHAPSPPCTVTADYAIKLLRPTPMDQPVQLRARPAGIHKDRVLVEATLEAGGKPCASCQGTFVAVKPGHPAFHRW